MNAFNSLNGLPRLTNIIQSIFGVAALSDKNRPIRLILPADQADLQQGMLIQHVSGSESLCGGLDLDVICLATSALIPTKALMAIPIGIQLVTDQGNLHTINGIVTASSSGQSDGSLSIYRLRVQDTFALFKHRRNSRVFMNKNIIQITDVFFDEWKKNSPLFASSMTLYTSGLKQNYSELPFTYQYDENDFDFLSRHWRKHGIAWFVKPADSNSGLGQVLCLFDDEKSLAQNSAGTVRNHRSDATESRDTLTSWTGARTLTSGSSSIQQWQPQAGSVTSASQTAKNTDQQGRLGSLSSMLEDSQIFTPTSNLADNDMVSLGLLQIQRHELASKCFHGESTVRDLRVGEWISIDEHPELDQHPDNERQFVITELHYDAANNLPKGVQNQVETLLKHSQWLPTTPFQDNAINRYVNHFTAIRRGIPLTPAFDHKIDVPHASPQIATVVTPSGEEVHCDDWGRVKIMFNGMRTQDHAHAGNAGSSSTDSDSAWVEVITSFAGDGFGSITLPRNNESVIVEFLNADPDRPVIMGRTYNGVRQPPKFSDAGSLPNNRYLSGIVSQEVKGSRKNQLRFDDTTGQISAQLSSKHGDSQLNLGFLTQPRDWSAEARGEGFELRTDNAGAIRAEKGLYVSTHPQTSAKGQQLDVSPAQASLSSNHEMMQSLSKVAEKQKSNPFEALDQLKSCIDALEAAGEDAKVKAFKEAVLIIAAPSDIAFTTPQNIHSHAGENITQSAGESINVAAGKDYTLATQQGINLFSFDMGANLIAAKGAVQIQAQSDNLEASALKTIKMTSTQDGVEITATKYITLRVGGNQIKISPDGIQLTSSKPINYKGSQHIFASGGNASGTTIDLPKPCDEQMAQASSSGQPAVKA